MPASLALSKWLSQELCYLKFFLFHEGIILNDLRNPKPRLEKPYIILRMDKNYLGIFEEIIEENARLLNKFSKIVVEAYNCVEIVGDFTVEDLIKLEELFTNLESLITKLESSDNEVQDPLIQIPQYESFKNAALFSHKILNLIPVPPQFEKSLQGIIYSFHLKIRIFTL